MILAALFSDIGRSLRESFFMFWETLWPLVLGFGLSGAVQAFVSHEEMESALGNHRPAALGRASVLGMVSSSCSYAASAMAKSLFQKGGDFVSALVFMFASTNLVLELGIVLVVLMGWQFAAAEFVGGPIMIVLLGSIGAMVFTPALIESARRRLSVRDRDPHDHPAMSGVTEDRQQELERQPWRVKLTSRAAWSDAASYTIADLKMLRRELLIGYLVAGFLTVLVPARVWNAVFIQGHGGWTTLENALVGPVIAFFSFVCSIGNVPMAAALWNGGISFAGVISFLFADLISAPLVLVYRRYYGGGITLRLVALFWAVMAGAGLIVEEIFSPVGLIPKGHRLKSVVTTWHWNSTSILNVLFLLVFGYLYWLYRNRERLGGGSGYALDPVCGMQVLTANAPASVVLRGARYWFCSDHCAERFRDDPERFERSPAPRHIEHEQETTVMAVDPVCGMAVDPATAAAVRSYEGRNYFFCTTGCAEAFDANPGRYAATTPVAEV